MLNPNIEKIILHYLNYKPFLDDLIHSSTETRKTLTKKHVGNRGDWGRKYGCTEQIIFKDGKFWKISYNHHFLCPKSFDIRKNLKHRNFMLKQMFNISDKNQATNTVYIDW